MEEVLGEVTPLQERARRIQRIFDAGVNAGLNSVRKTKADMDRQLSAQDCSKLASVIIWFSGELCLASTGAMTPNQDLYGNILQRLELVNNDLQPLFCSLVATSNGGALVFCWPRTASAGERFVTSLIEKGGEDLPSFLVQFLCLFLENTYFSPKWCTSLSELQKRQIEGLATTSNAYRGRINFARSRFVPWQTLNVKVSP
jgi:hypothetical protein